VTTCQGWAFYDTAEWMNNSYGHGVKARWEHEREAKTDALGSGPVLIALDGA
jgi:hypothetical protein